MPPHFTGLPREIRVAILELCLVVEGPINPYPTYYQYRDPFEKNNRKPDVALFKVNKNIHAEASRIFYGRNLWKLNWRIEDYPQLSEVPLPGDLFEYMTSLPRDKIWTTHWAQIHHITLDLDVREVDTTTLLQHTKIEYERAPSGTSSAKRRDKIHDRRYMVLLRICEWKFRTIRGMHIKSAYIDVENLFCLQGCCRSGLMRSAFFDHLRTWASYKIMKLGHQDGARLGRASRPVVTVVGFRNKDELDTTRRWWEELHETQLEHITGMDGQPIGLTGFYGINKRNPDCS